MTYLAQKVLIFAAAGLFSCALMPHQAQAIPITGGISLAGGYIAEDNSGVAVTDLTLATQIDFNINSGLGIATGGSGTFASIAYGTPVQFNIADELVFDPGLNPVLMPLFTVSGFSFDLLTATEVSGTTPDTLTIRGTGNFYAAGYDTTAGTFVATFNTAANTFSFSASGATTVPDGGSAVALLGIALVGVEGLRRKLRFA